MKELQKAVDEFILSTEEGYWKPLQMYAALVEEVGELGRCLNAKEGVKAGKGSDRLQEEMGDVLFALICLANQYNIDLKEALERSIEKYAQRS